jgi:signal transduction histidine kinase
MPATPSADALGVFVDLLAELDADGETGSRPVYDRVCKAVCRLTSMRRAALFLYDDGRRLVVPAGSHGVEPELLSLFYGTLDETPLAEQALADDRVVHVADLEGTVPERYAHMPDITALTCVPVAAGGRWLGVIFADRDGEDFTLTEQELDAMWMLGKMAALAASAQLATAQQERSRLLSDRIRLAREIHERVIQRLFGVSMVLGSTHEMTEAERGRCAVEMQTALKDLRVALAEPLAPEARGVGVLDEELARLEGGYKGRPVRVRRTTRAELPPQIEALAVAMLAEALRNADKHADPSGLDVVIGGDDSAFTLEVRNDGVAPRPRRRPSKAQQGSGIGLRLAALEAVQHGGVLEFGPAADEAWHVRLVLPLTSGRR